MCVCVWFSFDYHRMLHMVLTGITTYLPCISFERQNHRGRLLNLTYIAHGWNTGIRPPRTSTGRPCKPEQLTTFPVPPIVQTVISTFQGLAQDTYGALDRGCPMLHVNFKKWHVHRPSFCNFHVDFKKVPCNMSVLRKTLCHVNYFLSHVDRLHVACTF